MKTTISPITTQPTTTQPSATQPAATQLAAIAQPVVQPTIGDGSPTIAAKKLFVPFSLPTITNPIVVIRLSTSSITPVFLDATTNQEQLLRYRE